MTVVVARSMLALTLSVAIIMLVWLAHETAPTRRRNRALRERRRNTPRS